MKNSSLYISTAALLIVLLTHVRATAHDTLSLAQCRQMAIEHNLTLRSAERTIDKQKAERWALRTLYLPKISGRAVLAHMATNLKKDIYMPTAKFNPATNQMEPNLLLDPSGNPIVAAGTPLFELYGYMPMEIEARKAYMAGINLEQPLFTGGKIRAANAMANIGVELAEQNASLQRQNAIAEADEAYWTYVSVREKVKLAQTAVALLDTITTQMRNAVETGLKHRSELLKIQVQRNEAELNQQKAQNGLALARMALARAIGLPLNSPIETADSLIDCAPLPPQSEADISQRPEYRLLSGQVQLEEQQIKLQQADFMPLVGISAGYSFLGGVKLTGMELKTNGLAILGSVSIPIFHWGEGQQKMKAANISKEIKEMELERYSQLMQLEMEQARLNLNDARTRINLSEQALAMAEEHLRLSRNAYELGGETITNLLLAQTQWQQASAELIEAKADYMLKQTLYLKAAGLPLEQ